MPDPLRHVRVLAEEIGPRAATSPGEARAARYIAEAARVYTHQVWLEPFRTFTTPRLPWLLIFGTCLLGVMLLPFNWQASAVFVTVGAVGGLGQALHWIELGWLFPLRESQNVVAVVPSAAAIRRRLVLVTHVDSPIGGHPGEGAAGPALVLAAGELLARAPLRHTEVWTVFTGSREPGMAGLHYLLQQYGHMLADADFVVLDRIRGGAPLFSLTEGRFPAHISDGDLAGYLRELGLAGVDLTGHETQASLLLDEGFRTVALLTVGQGQVSPRALHDLVRLLGALGGCLDRDACTEAEADSAGM